MSNHDCNKCRWATWDCFEYYNTRKKQWFVDGCKKEQTEDDCTEYEEREEE
ncbi:hypothetical protein [Butyrivibrio sp. INlla21]|uniref:hypothetical protein n=1 Tax=Butyrivibrio sp. INlla21 TaxID=1520811 RepID=UPI0008F38EEA|nr:hypothetical protein [Butyrivibrio sp. INlla21]SFU57164.1 hypothetical protein SAMN02910342_00929 [Butyrivibrio sp. INlla21]